MVCLHRRVSLQPFPTIYQCRSLRDIDQNTTNAVHCLTICKAISIRWRVFRDFGKEMWHQSSSLWAILEISQRQKYRRSQLYDRISRLSGYEGAWKCVVAPKRKRTCVKFLLTRYIRWIFFVLWCDVMLLLLYFTFEWKKRMTCLSLSIKIKLSVVMLSR